MTGAVALAIVLVVAVAGISMAMESQRTMQSPSTRPRVPRPPGNPITSVRRPRDKMRDRARDKTREKRNPDPSPLSSMPPPTTEPREPEVKGPELLRTGLAGEAKVISVVDERTIGPVTRSRLALKIQPEEGTSFEVTVRIAFPTPEARARVRVGGTIPVRYDKDDRTRVVVDLPPE